MSSKPLIFQTTNLKLEILKVYTIRLQRYRGYQIWVWAVKTQFCLDHFLILIKTKGVMRSKCLFPRISFNVFFLYCNTTHVCTIVLNTSVLRYYALLYYSKHISVLQYYTQTLLYCTTTHFCTAVLHIYVLQFHTLLYLSTTLFCTAVLHISAVILSQNKFHNENKICFVVYKTLRKICFF